MVYYDTVAEFLSRTEDDDVYVTPDILLRVVDGEVQVICINPTRNQPWYGA